MLHPILAKPYQLRAYNLFTASPKVGNLMPKGESPRISTKDETLPILQYLSERSEEYEASECPEYYEVINNSHSKAQGEGA